jgi:hypothetical protein
MKLLSQYLDHALKFESLAGAETNPKLKADLGVQAKAYRKLAPSALQNWGCRNQAPRRFQLPHLQTIINNKMKARDDGKQHGPWTTEDDRRLREFRAAGRSTVSFAAASNAQGRPSGIVSKACEPAPSNTGQATTTQTPVHDERQPA